MQLKLKGKDFLLWIINIVLLIASIIEAFSSKSIQNDNWAEVAFYLSIICISVNVLTMISLKVRISDFRIPFTVLTYLFMYGRIWLHYLNLDSEIFWVLHKFFLYDNLQLSSLYVVACTQALFIGLFIKESLISKEEYVLSNDANYGSGMLSSTGYLLLMIGIPCRLITDINSIMSTATTGNYNSITIQTGLVDDFAHLLIPGLLCLLEAKPKIRKPLIIIIAVYYIAMMSVTGDRRYYVAGLLAIVAYYLSKREERIRPIRAIGIIALGVIFLNFLEIIRVMRLGGLGSVLSFASKYGTDLFVFDNLLYDVLAEFGISFYSVVNIVSNIPGYMPFQYGATLLRCIPSVLPIGSFFGDFFDKASPSTLINKYTGYPVGATMFGDLYANFSIWGILVCVLLGLVIYSIFEKRKKSTHPLRTVLYYTSYYILINMVRCTFFEIFRAYIWCIYIPIIIYSLINRKTGRAS